VSARGQRYVLSRRFYQSLGLAGVYTRKNDLGRDTNKAPLVKHIKQIALSGAKMQTLRQVLPNLSRSQIQVLLRDLISIEMAALETAAQGRFRVVAEAVRTTDNRCIEHRWARAQHFLNETSVTSQAPERPLL
jgi:hypothetical protein